MSKSCMEWLHIATAALRDLYVGYPHDDIAGGNKIGLNNLIHDLALYLRGCGSDDEGAFDCDATEGILLQSAPAFTPFRLVVEAHANSEYGMSPSYAEIMVDPLFIGWLLRLRRLCEENALETASTSYAPDRWHLDDVLNPWGGELVVSRGESFWFMAYPRKADYSIETRLVEIDDLLKIVEAGPGVFVPHDRFQWHAGMLYYANETSTIEYLIEDFKIATEKAGHQSEFDGFRHTYATLMAELRRELAGKENAMYDFFHDQIDLLKAKLAADAANNCGDDEVAQEEAIEVAESWVTENISGTLLHEIAATLWLSGPAEGSRLIRETASNIQNGTGMSTQPAIAAWNTGRRYSNDGQRIAAQILPDRRVAFCDYDRAIDGVTTNTFEAEESNADIQKKLRAFIMDEYDHCRYSGGLYGLENHIELRHALIAAAKAVGPTSPTHRS